MAIEITNLMVTVRVAAAQRVSLAQAHNTENQNRAGQRHLLLPPVPPQATGESSVPLTPEETRPDAGSWAVEDVDVYQLSDRVFDFMRYDARIGRERRGG